MFVDWMIEVVCDYFVVVYEYCVDWYFVCCMCFFGGGLCKMYEMEVVC